MKNVLAKGFWEAQPIKHQYVQLSLFDYQNNEPCTIDYFLNVEDGYSLVNLKRKCRDLMLRKFPKKVECEEQHDYLQFIEDEATLEFCDQLRKIADNLEEKVLGR